MFKRWIKSLIVPPARSRAPHAARRYRFRSEALEDRTVPAGNFATGAAFGEAPIVRVFDGNTRQQVAAIQVFDTGFRGGVNVAMGDVTGDGVADVVAGSALGFSHVKVFDGVTFQQVSSFMVFDRFAGGINVAAGDIDGDGKADLAVAVANGGGTHVKAFSGADGSELASFFAYGQGFVGGVNVTLGDVDGDGKADIVTGAGPGSGGHVKVFDGATGSEFRSFLVFSGFSGSIDLSVGDTNGDGKAEVLVGAGPGAGPHVKAYDGATGALDASFFAFAEAFLGGVSVGVDADGHIVVAGTGRSHVKTFDGVTGAELSSALIQGSASGRIGTAPEPTALTITSSATASAAENQTAVLTVTTSRTATYRIAGGADAALFAIDPTTGVLTFVTAPDFEEPADAGTNNVYDVTVEATNGTATTTQDIAVTVTDVNESTALAITSGAAVSVTENQTAVRTVTTSGGSGAPVTYSIVAVGSGGGADATLFAINPTTGVLTFVAAPNFEIPTDGGTNNVYNVTVQATDGTFTTSQDIAVTVTDINDAPSGADGSVDVNDIMPYTFAASDFGFSDTDGGTLLAVKITTLPALGSLQLNGVAVTTGQVISAGDIGTLTFTAPMGAYGIGYTTFTFQVQDNGGTTNGGIDLDPTPKTITVNVYAV